MQSIQLDPCAPDIRRLADGSTTGKQSADRKTEQGDREAEATLKSDGNNEWATSGDMEFGKKSGAVSGGRELPAVPRNGNSPGFPGLSSRVKRLQSLEVSPEALAAALMKLALADRVWLASMLLGQQPGQGEGKSEHAEH